MTGNYYIYILASKSRRLYVGVTSDLEGRIYQHKHKLIPGFTARYNINRLVYIESFTNIDDAIAREKQIKKWRREKKIWLVESMNKHWKDLSETWYPGDGDRDSSTPLRFGRNDKSKAHDPVKDG